MKRYQIIGLVGLFCMMSACSDNKQSQVESSQQKLANPAAVFCAERGKYDISSGQCMLEDNTQVDAWDFYRKYHADQSVGLENPAAAYCISSQGEYDINTSECKFADGRIVNAWDYFKQQSSK
ncbi:MULTISPECIES: DUF333 domain-containing protein [Shewanella]|uniref:DUF333 domain-containing protein n=1 Tax=Shewanella japonica TaxID=93973 RepID=A0ABN4YC44_9GAMM|nr:MULTISPECIES: DUF333 domain-containing protein [Shewanella]ARD21161.1 hypothetical protein SJ2017_0829 [Shewanella japonica]